MSRKSRLLMIAKKLIRKTLIIILISLSSMKLFAKPLELKELINHAITHSPSFKNSINNLTITELRKENAFSSFLPSLDLEAIHGLRDGNPLDPFDKYPSELQLSLTSTLYNNGTNFINYDRAKFENKAGLIELERDRSLLCLNLSREYYNYTLAAKVLQVQEFQYALLKKQFRSIENQYRQGRKTRIDYIRFKARLQRADLSMQQAQVTKSKSIEEIKKIINWSTDLLEIFVEEKIELKDQIPTKIPSLEDHYDYQLAQLGKSINQFDVTLAKRRYWPELFFNANASYTNSDYSQGFDSFSDKRQTNWEALITLRFNLWDWGTRKRNLTIATIEKETRNNTIDDNLLVLQSTINKLLLDIKQQKKNYLLNNELVLLEKNNYETIEQSYRSGRSTFLDLINALNNYTSSQESFYRDLFQLKSFIAEYQHHQGTLYETIQNN